MATKLQTVEIKLPFPGFYHSHYSADIDWEEEQHIAHHVDESDGDEAQWPEALRLDYEAYSQTLLRATSYRDAYTAIAREYVAAFSTLAGEALGISARESVRFYSWAEKRYKRERREVSSLRLTFAAMNSPREYNFETDRVFANVPLSVIRKLWAISRDDGHKTLTRVAAERHTSRSGFCSFYSAAWADWGQVATWDHNQLETLLIAACEVQGFDWDDSDLAIYYAIGDGEGPYQAWEKAVDWPAYESALQEKRAEKLAAWMESEPAAALVWTAKDDRAAALLQVDDVAWPDVDESCLPYRRKLTPDLFPETLKAES